MVAKANQPNLFGFCTVLSSVAVFVAFLDFPSITLSLVSGIGSVDHLGNIIIKTTASLTSHEFMYKFLRLDQTHSTTMCLPVYLSPDLVTSTFHHFGLHSMLKETKSLKLWK